jgi:predicted RNase H-like HicB family nuclease
VAERYIFPAIFYPPEQEGIDFCVVFPDLNVATQGETLLQALDMAKELLELTLFGLEEDGEKIPVASDPSIIALDRPGAFVTLVSAYMPIVRAEMAQRFVRKTVTLPRWLNDIAEQAGINFSRSLQTALRLKLEVSDPMVHVAARGNRRSKRLLSKDRM